MKETTLDLPFPKKGLVTNVPFDQQPVGTTPKMVNVVVRDPSTGRDRGAQRGGLSKYNTNQVSAGAVQIQCLTHCVFSGAGVAQLSSRILRPIVVAGGNLQRFSAGSGAMTTPTGGAAAFSASAKMIFADQLFQQAFFCDGVSQPKLYDAPTDAVSALVASQGSLPVDSGSNPGRLLVVWRNRLVISGLPLDPRNWFMSAVGDATNWNYAPANTVETQAVAGNNSTAGQSLDLITCMIPYNDEVLLLGGDHSIWQITGDPMAGGRIDPVTDAVGMAWGQPWCRDGQGQIYFVSNRGSIYRVVPGNIPERISDQIADLTLTINVANKGCRMAWDERQQQFVVWFTSIAGAAAETHYVYDVRNGAWSQLVHANNNLNPLAVHTLDGDAPGDRAVLVGSFDGFVRKLDPLALDDDGTAISTSVFYGPIKDKNANGIYLTDLSGGLDNASGNATWNVRVGKDAETAFNAAAFASGTFTAGRNRSVPLRAFGHALYVELASNVAAAAWQAEYFRATLRLPDGSLRRRTFAL